MKTKFCVKKKTITVDCRSFWHFFDWKAYLIMTCMMSGGIGFRAAGIFIAFFLFRSGLSFGTGRSYFYKKNYMFYNQLIEKEQDL